MSRKAYVATDEPQVLTELNLRYPNIEWLIIESKTSQYSVLDKRYTHQGQDAIVKDIFMLANSDFLVCTFSSNVCRLAYELRYVNW